jgi:hypothetical protein
VALSASRSASPVSRPLVSSGASASGATSGNDASHAAVVIANTTTGKTSHARKVTIPAPASEPNDDIFPPDYGARIPSREAETSHAAVGGQFKERLILDYPIARRTNCACKVTR